MRHDGDWDEGTPSWSDLQVDDVAAAQSFYGAVFGWEFHQQPDEAGGYTLTLLHGRPVAGIGPKYSDAPTVSSVQAGRC